jgi:hypothetical protein
VTVVDTLGEPVVLINNDGTPAYLAYSAKTYLGGVAPYHWLDFINNRALYAGADVGTVADATGYSFSRASDGYYTNSDGTLTLFGSGALRRGDRGVLIEGARTNLLVRSQEFDNAAWVKSNATVTADTATAPDGTTTADTVTGVTSGAANSAYQEITAIASVYTFSLWVRAGTATTCAILVRDNTAATNLSVTAQILSGPGSVTGSTAVTVSGLSTTEWTRVSLTSSAAATAGNTLRCLFYPETSVSVNTTSKNNIIWGAQLEAASFPSSYIPTVAAAATRAADVLTYTVNTTAQINAAVAGQPELVTDPSFDNAADWTTSANTSVSDGAGRFLAPTVNGDNITPAAVMSLVAGKYYAVTFTVADYISGSVRLETVGGTQVSIGSITATANGTYTEILAAKTDGTTSNDKVRVRTTQTNTSLSISDISVKEVPANSLTLYPLSLWAEFERAGDTGTTEALLRVDDGSTANAMRLVVSSADRVFVDVNADSVGQGNSSPAQTIAVGAITKGAARADTDSIRACANGTLGPEDTSATLPSDPTRLCVGSGASGTEQPFAYIRRAAIFNSALTDAQLQTVTGS